MFANNCILLKESKNDKNANLSSDEQHEGRSRTDDGQLSPIQPSSHDECRQKSDLRKDFGRRAEAGANGRVRDFADVNLCGHLNDGGKESG